MAEFRKLAEIALPRKNKRTGNAEELRIQLMEADNGARFVTLCTFWRAESGEFFPPNREVPRLTIRRDEAAQVVALLEQLSASKGSTPQGGAPARAEPPARGEPPAKGATDRRNGYDASRGRRMTSQRPSTCVECGQEITPGDLIVYDGQAKRAAHAECVDDDDDSGPVGEAARRVASGAGRQRPLFSGEGCIT